MVFEAADVMAGTKGYTMAEAGAEAVVVVVKGVEGEMLERPSHFA